MGAKLWKSVSTCTLTSQGSGTCFWTRFESSVGTQNQPRRWRVEFNLDMRIAYVTADPGVPVFGQKGCSIHVQEVLRALARRGAQIELFATNCAGVPPADLANVRLHSLPLPPEGELAFREQQCLAANEPIRAALEAAGAFTLIYERYSLWGFAA